MEKEIFTLIYHNVRSYLLGFFEVLMISICYAVTYSLIADNKPNNIALNIPITMTLDILNFFALGILSTLFFARLFIKEHYSIRHIFSQLTLKSLLTKQGAIVLGILASASLCSSIINSTPVTEENIPVAQMRHTMDVIVLGLAVTPISIASYLYCAISFCSLNNLTKNPISPELPIIRDLYFDRYFIAMFKSSFLLVVLLMLIMMTGVEYSVLILKLFDILIALFFAGCFAHATGVKPTKKKKAKALKLATES